MNDEDARLTPEEEEELFGAVIRRTSGGACGRAEELLAEYWDRVGRRQSSAPTPAAERRSRSFVLHLDELDETDRALLGAHLEHCEACAALARALAVAGETLPTFASIDPGPAFTAAVLTSTSPAEPAGFGERLGAFWNAWLARPRFALELAYVATLLLVLIVGNPAARLQAASARTVTAAASGIERAREALPGAIGSIAPAELPALESVRSRVVERGTGVTGGLAGAWDRAMVQWSATFAWLRGMAFDVFERVSGTWTNVRTTIEGWMKSATEPKKPAAR